MAHFQVKTKQIPIKLFVQKCRSLFQITTALCSTDCHFIGDPSINEDLSLDVNSIECKNKLEINIIHRVQQKSDLKKTSPCGVRVLSLL